MRKIRLAALVAVLAVALATTGAGIASAAAKPSVPTRAFGSADIYCEAFHTGEGQLGVGTLEMEAQAASGDPARKNYRPATGYATLVSDVPVFNFTFVADEVDFRSGGLTAVRGNAADGTRWSVLVIDGGTPGTLYDQVWITRYDPLGNQASIWYLTSGDFVVR